MKTYFTIMLRTVGDNVREWYVQEFLTSDNCYQFQKANGLEFGTFEECETAAIERAENIGGRYINFVPRVGVTKNSRLRRRKI